MKPFERIYSVVRRIPKGCAASYGQVAALAGNPRWSRAVGYALHSNPDPENIPCHRVVNRFGRCCEGFVFGGMGVQIGMLRSEGIEVSEDGYLDLCKYGVQNHPEYGAIYGGIADEPAE
ncbi:MAG: MGMT family protein [Oscillospiraceae bacterium]|nr:MGMT family protein [Oscillospiraceae bacterium]